MTNLNRQRHLVITSIVLAFAIMISAGIMDATAARNQMLTICHIAGTGIGSTINIPNANDYDSHLQNHLNDHDGACAVAESTDTDGDGISNAFDTCPTDPTNTCKSPQDTTPPIITENTVCSIPGNSGWCRGDATVQWTITDPESTITSKSDCDTTTINYDVANKVLTCSATSSGGTSSISVVINRDAAAPITSPGSQSPPANENGWNNSDVQVTFACTDSLSGVIAPTSSSTVSTEGQNQSVSGQCQDVAGNTSSATFSGINIDETAPITSPGSQSPPANENGWNNSDVQVTFACTDSLSGVIAPTSSSTVSTEGQNQSVSGQCQDKAGNTSSVSYFGINVDKTVPGISTSRTPAANEYGWNNSDVTVLFSCTDDLSGVTSPGTSQTFDEGVNQSASSQCTDKAGNTSDVATVENINIDKKAPSISSSQSPTANEYGWNNSDVTVTYTCTDDSSGVINPLVNVTLSTEGSNQSVTGQCDDKAGNSSTKTDSGINIDKTSPDISSTTMAAYVLGQPVSISCNDSLSGILTCDGQLNTGTAGLNTKTILASDKAGNTSTSNLTFQVNYDLKCGSNNGQFSSPIPNTSYSSGRTVPEKFAVCDYNGNKVSNVVATSMVDGMKATSSGKSNVDNYFRYDDVDQQYVYNMASKGLAIGKHVLTALLDSGQSISSTVSFTK